MSGAAAMSGGDRALAEHLLTVEAVRERCMIVQVHVEQGRSSHFRWQADRLPVAVQAVVDTIRRQYPDLKVPYHSRRRHLEAGGIDRWSDLVRAHYLSTDDAERARVAIGLTIVSVLLDAGAGPDWRYEEAASGRTFVRSEGLGVASLHFFTSGVLSDHEDAPLRGDASALRAVTAAQLGEAFQVSAENPLVGLEGRAGLLNALGRRLSELPEVFGEQPRLGVLYDHLLTLCDERRQLPARVLIKVLLQALNPVWPGRATLAGVPLGDCWRHAAVPDGWVPFHKLTQWLAYSLIEPLAEGGIELVGLEAMTGLPEYRNGGLLLDTGLLEPLEADFATRAWNVDDEAIVEWRACTVIALDRIADGVRTALGVDAAAFPLARVLEGGTWAAGRALAAEKRPGGPPPLNLVSDGTVF